MIETKESIWEIVEQWFMGDEFIGLLPENLNWDYYGKIWDAVLSDTSCGIKWFKEILDLFDDGVFLAALQQNIDKKNIHLFMSPDKNSSQRVTIEDIKLHVITSYFKLKVEQKLIEWDDESIKQDNLPDILGIAHTYLDEQWIDYENYMHQECIMQISESLYLLNDHYYVYINWVDIEVIDKDQEKKCSNR